MKALWAAKAVGLLPRNWNRDSTRSKVPLLDGLTGGTYNNHFHL